MTQAQVDLPARIDRLAKSFPIPHAGKFDTRLKRVRLVKQLIQDLSKDATKTDSRSLELLSGALSYAEVIMTMHRKLARLLQQLAKEVDDDKTNNG